MKELLDTHTLLWALFTEQNFSDRAGEVLDDPSHRTLVSIASAWGIAIKQGLGKLPYLGNLHRLIDEGDTEYLAITSEHCRVYSQLPHDGAHRDHFDQTLVVQAIEEDAHLLGRDPALDRYNVRRIW